MIIGGEKRLRFHTAERFVVRRIGNRKNPEEMCRAANSFVWSDRLKQSEPVRLLQELNLTAMDHVADDVIVIVLTMPPLHPQLRGDLETQPERPGLSVFIGSIRRGCKIKFLSRNHEPILGLRIENLQRTGQIEDDTPSHVVFFHQRTTENGDMSFPARLEVGADLAAKSHDEDQKGHLDAQDELVDFALVAGHVVLDADDLVQEIIRQKRRCLIIRFFHLFVFLLFVV